MRLECKDVVRWSLLSLALVSVGCSDDTNPVKGPDARVMLPDTGTMVAKPDSSVPMMDARTPVPDGGQPIDSGMVIIMTDSGPVIMTDSGAVPVDATVVVVNDATVDSGTSPVDGGPNPAADGAIDSGAVVAVDSGTPVDSSVAPVDSGTPGVDSGSPLADAGHDGGTDGGVVLGDNRPDWVGCEENNLTVSCEANEVCCTTSGCQASSTACMGGVGTFPLKLDCDGPEDCTSGSNRICCLTDVFAGGGSAFASSCAADGLNIVRLCHTPSDCPAPPSGQRATCSPSALQNPYGKCGTANN